MIDRNLIIQGLLFLSLGVTLLSCENEGDNFLDGSLVKNYNISYESVRVRRYTNELAVEYISKEEVAALRISIDLTAALLAEGKTYDLAKYGTVTRYSDYGELPTLSSGELTLETFSETDGDLVSGEFNAIFVNDTDGKQTLRGAFKADLEVVPL